MSSPPAPTTMKGMVRVAYGTQWSDIFQLRDDLAVPQPQASQVLIKVHATSVNPGEVKLAAGWIKRFVSESLPRVPGLDVAGEVVQVGSQVTRFQVGDPVFGDCGIPLCGACAQYAVAEEKSLARKPEALSFEQAAALPVAGMTAVQAVRLAEIQEGSQVIVRGASGGVGHVAVQVAKALGASKVIAISSAVQLCQQIGADQVINYIESDWVAQLENQQLDALIDCVGGTDSWPNAPRVLKPKNAKFVPVCGDYDLQEPVSFSFIFNMIKNTISRKFSATIFGTPAYLMFVTDATKYQDLELMATLAQQGKLSPVIEKQFDFTPASLGEMYKRQSEGRIKGKLVMKVC